MSIENFNVPLTCLFCGGVLEAQHDSKFESGDLIPCGHCNEGNDYDSVIEVAKEKGVTQVKEAFQATLGNIFKPK
jgi:hypothetical protein